VSSSSRPEAPTSTTAGEYGGATPHARPALDPLPHPGGGLSGPFPDDGRGAFVLWLAPWTCVGQGETLGEVGRGDEVARGLERSAVFGLFSAKMRERLGAGGARVSLETGRLLCQQGDLSDAAWLVLKGAIEVRSTMPDGTQVCIAVLGPGEVAGEMGVLDGAARSADMAAARNTELLRISAGSFVSALEAEPAAALALIRALSMRLRAADRKLEAARTQDLGSRLAALLLDEATGAGAVALTQVELARRLGASREKVNRKLHAWRAEGVVAVSRTGARILRRDVLERVCARIQTDV
jgi:CRP/FNR family cyclic AMP-dependent transcriptional regulator